MSVSENDMLFEEFDEESCIDFVVKFMKIIQEKREEKPTLKEFEGKSIINAMNRLLFESAKRRNITTILTESFNDSNEVRDFFICTGILFYTSDSILKNVTALKDFANAVLDIIYTLSSFSGIKRKITLDIIVEKYPYKLEITKENDIIYKMVKSRILGNLRRSPYDTRLYNVRCPGLCFTGRTIELRQIDDFFCDSYKLVCISGQPGVGKTQLAKMYIKKYQGNFSEIAWINCENGSCTNEENFKYFKEQSLLVFDNAQTQENIQSYLADKHINSSILVTSRNANWPKKDWKIIEVNPFSESEALQFVTKSLRLSKNDSVVQSLIQRHRHPQDLQQAVESMLTKLKSARRHKPRRIRDDR